jgi:hypothetical protein
VSRYVQLREAGNLSAEPARRVQLIDPYLDKLEEWMEASKGKLRADRAHKKLEALGFSGSPRTTRRAVAAARRNWSKGNRRLYRPWIPEPGMWFQWDFGDGPSIEGRKTWLFCAWLSWSRFRVVLPIWDKTLPTVIACIDTTLRRFGGVPTYSLTDNEKTVTTDIVARIPIRHLEIVAAGAHYGLTIHTCVVADPESKGGSEATVRIAKADLVPTEANLLDEYRSFAELEEACAAAMATFNGRIHSVTRRVPSEALQEELAFLHRLPDAPYTAAFGESRRVGWSSVVSYRGARYSVPHAHCDTRVWVRTAGDEVIIVAGEGSGAKEVARHRTVAPGGSSICDEHYPERTREPRERRPRPTSRSEEQFLALGEGAKRYLVEGAATGARRLEARMAEAVCLAALHGAGQVDEALGLAAMAGRFWEGDLESILVHAAGELVVRSGSPDEHSLAQGTSSWSNYKTPSAEAGS